MQELPKAHMPETFDIHPSSGIEYPKLTPKPQPHALHAPYPELHSTGSAAPGTKLILGMQLPILTTKNKRPAVAYRG
jgi:hypothetical protein